MNYDFASIGITLDNVKDFETALAEYKKTLRADAKQATADAKALAVDDCNDAIADGRIVKGATVVVKYNKTEVTGTITNTPTAEARTTDKTTSEIESDIAGFTETSGEVPVAEKLNWEPIVVEWGERDS